MRVLITKVTDNNVWYSKLLNTIVDVKIGEYYDKYYKVESNNGNGFIRKENCEVVGMNKLNIKNKYNSENLTISFYEDSRYAHVSLKSNDGGDNMEIRIGKNYNTTIDQTNQILKIMNLPYELVDEIDWSEVKVGTKIKYNRTPFSHKESSVGQFHSYVKELNKITIIDEYNIIVKDVNECEVVI